MEYQQNTMARVALGAGVGAVVLQVVAMCIGCIPIISLLNVFIGPVMWILDLVAVFAGIGGMSVARATGEGRGAAMSGLLIGLLHILFQVVIIGGIVALYGTAILLSVIGQA